MLKASTIIEVLVAMILLSITVGIGSLSFTTTINNNQIPIKVKAVLALQKIAETTKTTKRYFDEEIEEFPLLIKKTVTPYTGHSHIIVLKLEAFDINKAITKPIVPSYQQLIYIGK